MAADGYASGTSTAGLVEGFATVDGAIFGVAWWIVADARGARGVCTTGVGAAGRGEGTKYTRGSGASSRSTDVRVVAYSAATTIAACSVMAKNECSPVVVCPVCPDSMRCMVRIASPCWCYTVDAPARFSCPQIDENLMKPA